jgi:List-Bact-rpt repeat protein
VKNLFRAIAGLFAALGLSAGAAEISAESYVQPAVPSAKAALAKSERARATHVKEIVLPAQTLEALPKAMRERQKPGTPLQIGHGRPLPEVASDAIAALTWEPSPAGEKIGALSITSPGAVALRAGLRIYSLPTGATVRFYGRNDDALYEVSGGEILGIIASNLAAGDTSENAHVFWSPIVDDSTVVIEFELPVGARTSDLRVGVPQVAHMIMSAKTGFVLPQAMIEAAATCNLDANCSTATWGSQMNAVARMAFQDGGTPYACTGTLLATSPASTVPYFLTANHCISNATAANTLVTYWFYRSTACNSGVPVNSSTYQTRTGGASLLYHSPVTGNASTDNATYTDTSFLVLNATPPTGAVFAGWVAGTAPAIGTAVTGIHHPKGEYLRISFGSTDGYLTCEPPSGGGFNCFNSNTTSGTFHSNTWSNGLTEPGSSGSPLFRNSDGKLIGQLYGGISACPAGPSDFDVYGRFDKAFNAPGGMSGYLFSAVQFALTVAKAGTGSGTVSSAPTGIACGASCSANFSDGTVVALTASPALGSVFSSWSGVCTGTNPASCNVTMSAASSVTANFTAVPPVALSISKSGIGSGTVTSAPAGINCGTACSADFAVGTSVTLTAAPTGMSSFNIWSGACTGSGSTCTLTMDAAKSVTASFGPAPQVDVTKAGTGSGTVTSTTPGINCGTTCSAPFGQNSSVSLTARPDAGSSFAGWSGACTGARGCALTMTTSRAVTATFNGTGVSQQTLTVSKTGTGSGTLTSTPAGINCGATCSFNYATGTSVTLAQAAAGGSTFTGWGGACSGTGSCIVAMNAATSVSANFDATPPAGAPAVTVTLAGTGTGVVTSSPAGINCGTACSSTFGLNSSVTLTARANTGATFAGWSGACTGARSCILTMNAAKSVTATFNGGTPPPPPTQQTLTVSLAGTGSGSVSSSPAGISCGATCSANFNTGTAVTLSPASTTGSMFTGWSGACSGSGACTVTLNAAASVTATFDSVTPPPPGGANTLTIVKAGAGASLGSVTSTPAGIDCGATCSADFAGGTSVTLRAVVGAGRTFGGWSGGCAGTRTNCTLPVNAATSVTATFN